MAKSPGVRPDNRLGYYEVLEVSRRARSAVIHAAYKELMKVYHPDVMNGNGEMAKRINEAFETLGNVDRRKEYDALLEKSGASLIGGKYRVIEKIAEGGFGRTYKAEHVLSGKLVCIKDCFNLDPQLQQILVEEAQAVWDLRHYSLPVMRDIVELENGGLALVMSYIPGLTLEKVVEKLKSSKKKLSAEHVAWIAERALNALKYLHLHGVVHGDVKPQNIIIQPESHMIVLVDFGLSAVKPTSTSTSKGYTVLFSPPEEIAGKPLLPESDLYSLGMTMLFALSGDYECVEKVRVPATVPDPLCRFIRRLIVRDVRSRPEWGKEDLFETIQQVRAESFGRNRSSMEPIPGL